MANDDAWAAGWAQGSGAAQKKKDSKKQKSGKAGQDDFKIANTAKDMAKPPLFHKGGRVKKSGLARVRKNEVVLTVSQQKAVGLKKGGKKKAYSRKRVASKR